MTQTAKNYAQALFELHVDAESVKTTEEIFKDSPGSREKPYKSDDPVPGEGTDHWENLP